MLLKDAPKAFNRIVLAMVGGIISEPDVELAVVGQLDDALHKLRAAAMIFRTIILQKQERLYAGKLLTNLLPTVE